MDRDPDSFDPDSFDRGTFLPEGRVMTRVGEPDEATAVVCPRCAREIDERNHREFVIRLVALVITVVIMVALPFVLCAGICGGLFSLK